MPIYLGVRRWEEQFIRFIMSNFGEDSNFIKFIRKIPLSKFHVTLEDEYECQKKRCISPATCHHIIIAKVNHKELVNNDTSTILYLTEVLSNGEPSSAFVLCVQDKQKQLFSTIQENDYFGFSDIIIKEVSPSFLRGFGTLQAHMTHNSTPEVWYMRCKYQSEVLADTKEVTSSIDVDTKVTLFGVLKKIQRRIHPLNRTKEQIVLQVFDQHGDFIVVLHHSMLWQEPIDSLEIYCVLMIKNMQVLRCEGKCFGYVSSSENVCVFSRNDCHQEKYSTVLGRHKPTASQILKVRTLRSWVKAQSWYPWRNENFRTTWLLKDICNPVTVKLLCKVVNIRHMREENEVVLTVADGTTCSSYVKRCSDPETKCFNDVISEEGGYYRNNSEVDIFVSDVNEVASLQEGQFITIGDIIVISTFEGEVVNVVDSQSQIQDYLIFTLMKDSFTCCSVHSDDEAKLLKRELEEAHFQNSSKLSQTQPATESRRPLETCNSHTNSQSQNNETNSRRPLETCNRDTNSRSQNNETNSEHLPSSSNSKISEIHARKSNTSSNSTHFSVARELNDLRLSDEMRVTTDENVQIVSASSDSDIGNKSTSNSDESVDTTRDARLIQQLESLARHDQSIANTRPTCDSNKKNRLEVSSVRRNQLCRKSRSGDKSNLDSSINLNCSSKMISQKLTLSRNKLQSRSTNSRFDKEAKNERFPDKRILEEESSKVIENASQMIGMLFKKEVWILTVVENSNGTIVNCHCNLCKCTVKFSENAEEIICTKCQRGGKREDISFNYDFALAAIDEHGTLYKVVVGDRAGTKLFDCAAVTYVRDRAERNRINENLVNMIVRDKEKPPNMTLEAVFRFVTPHLISLEKTIKKPVLSNTPLLPL